MHLTNAEVHDLLKELGAIVVEAFEQRGIAAAPDADIVGDSVIVSGGGYRITLKLGNTTVKPPIEVHVLRGTDDPVWAPVADTLDGNAVLAKIFELLDPYLEQAENSEK